MKKEVVILTTPEGMNIWGPTEEAKEALKHSEQILADIRETNLDRVVLPFGYKLSTIMVPHE